MATASDGERPGQLPEPLTRRPRREEAEDAIRTFLRFVGENPEREGLQETPRRFLDGWLEMTEGYGDSPRKLLAKNFELDDDGVPLKYDQVISSGPMPFASNCEHHLLPFTGRAWIAYLPKPGGRVVGLSKLARLLDAYAKRLQVQERLTQQIANAVEEELAPLGVAVILKATHSCQALRGVKKPGEMTTSSMLGVFREDAAARAELFALLDL